MSKCPKCESVNIIDGWLISEVDVLFIEISDKIFNKAKSRVTASACKDCGQIFDLKLKNPEKFRRS